MARHPKFTLIFAPETLEHLDTIERKHHGLIRETIHEQLCYTPQRKTRNRKPLEQPTPFGATWELRFGPKNCFRVFYEIDTATQSVSVLAVGLKKGNRLFIGRKEIEL
jgi:mRNA-degrading endonuclease RelE of RelBE toxin-antitoxin system